MSFHHNPCKHSSYIWGQEGGHPGQEVCMAPSFRCQTKRERLMAFCYCALLIFAGPCGKQKQSLLYLQRMNCRCSDSRNCTSVLSNAYITEQKQKVAGRGEKITTSYYLMLCISPQNPHFSSLASEGDESDQRVQCVF